MRYLRHPPQGSFDDVLLRLFPSLEKLSFVQIGANDGRRADPLCKYIKNCGWQGVLVEPNPLYFRRLVETYRGCLGVRFMESALDTVAGESVLYFLKSGLPALPDWAQGTGSLDVERVRTVARELSLPADAVISSVVKTVSWSDVWTALGAQHCDVLALDTEGHDVVLLRSCDLALHRPRVIHFEHACISKAERLAFYGELLDMNYELATSHGDTIAYLASEASQLGKPALRFPHSQ